MAKKALPTPNELRQLLRYYPETGVLEWLPREEHRVEGAFNGARRVTITNAAFNKRFAGREALTAINSRGYRGGTIVGSPQVAHRVIWAIVMGRWPNGQIDHINGNRTDNRLVNLREATPRQNSANKKKQEGASSAFYGVTFRSDTKKWAAQIKDTGKRLHLGCFQNEEDAARAFDAAARRIHGNFARLNFA